MRPVLGLALFDTAIGTCGMAWTDAALACVQLPEATPERTLARLHARHPGVPAAGPPGFAAAAIRRIRRLLEGEHDDLRDVPLELGAVPAFHRRVYEVTRAIPPGRILTYGEVARRLAEPGAARAVGQALAANPFAPVVPCHRVLAAGGRAGGFSAAGGTATKLRMLRIERAWFGGEPGLFD